MYWANSNTIESIERANLDGSNRSVILLTAGSPKNVRLDIPNQHVYYTNNEGDGSLQGVFRINFDGTGQVQLINDQGYTGIDLDLINSKMYLTNQLDDTIERANLDGTGITILTSLIGGSPAPYGIAIIPEPGTYALMLGALALGLAGYLRLRRKNKANN